MPLTDSFLGDKGSSDLKFKNEWDIKYSCPKIYCVHGTHWKREEGRNVIE
jgi:hypothetical protein